MSVIEREQRVPGRGRVRQPLGGGHERGVVGVQYQRAAAADGARHDELGLGQIVRRLDAVLPEVIGADVGDHRHVGTLDGEAAAQDPPRAVSSTAKPTERSRSTARAPAGPE